MNNKKPHRVPYSARSSHFEDPSPSLLELWLSLPADGRDREFAGTSRAAELAGMLDWVNGRIIPSIRIGSRYRVHLPSMLKVLEVRSQPMGHQHNPSGKPE
jgi:hypothetical protein